MRAAAVAALFLAACEETAPPPSADGAPSRAVEPDDDRAESSPEVSARETEDTGSAAPSAPEAPNVPERSTVTGRVVYRGRLPERTTMYVLEAGRELEAHTVHVDPATRGVKDVAVWVEIPRGLRVPPPAPSPSPPAVMDQRDWVFAPHVLTVRAGQRVRFLNSDVANHNVHSRTSGHAFNLGTPAGEGTSQRFLRPTGGDPVRIECDIHDWMRAWIYVFPHHLHAVTGKEGGFRIEGVPPGRWTVRAHHADGELEASLEVGVEAGRTSEVELELGG